MKTFISQKMEIARESLGLTQGGIAHESGYMQSKVSLLENNKIAYLNGEYLSTLRRKK